MSYNYTILKDLWMSETKATLLKQMDEEKERIFDILQLLLQKLDLVENRTLPVVYYSS